MQVDVAIIGAGIAGAGLAYALGKEAPSLSIGILEAEDRPGYHTTGRSAAFFAATYGGPKIQPLSLASRPFLASPPKEFSNRPFLGARGALHLAPPAEDGMLAALQSEFEEGNIPFKRLCRKDILEKDPLLRSGDVGGAIWEPDCTDIAVAELHHAYLHAAKAQGAQLLCNMRVTDMEHRQGEGQRQGQWLLRSRSGEEVQAVTVVNAAGAWVDEVAVLAGCQPLGFQPMRRTIVVAEVIPEAPAAMPLVIDAGGRFYFRPDGGRLWISPHDETPTTPQDVQPEEEDVALTLARFEAVSRRQVRRIVTKWAGLRTFAPDRLPVVGYDVLCPRFFWLAGQGGWGIQTAPAMSALGAALLLGKPPADGIDPALYHPGRFR